MKRRSQQSSLRAKQFDVEKCNSNENEVPEQSKKSIVMVNNNDKDDGVPTPSRQLYLSKPSLAFTNQAIGGDDGTELIATPKSGNASVTTSIRQSERVTKTLVTKKGRSVKYKLRVPWSLPPHNIVPATTSIKTALPTNRFETGDFSPLCVKKKMSRRTLSNKKVQQQAMGHPNSNKKLPLTKPKVFSSIQERPYGGDDRGTGTSAKSNVVDNVSNPDSAALPFATSPQCNIAAQDTVEKPESGAKNTANIFFEYLPQDKVCSNIVADGMGIRDSILTDESILFERSSDFWDSFLLETYRQLASNNPDLSDFEPIPYHELARGIPVEVESSLNSVNGPKKGGVVNCKYSAVDVGVAKIPTSLRTAPLPTKIEDSYNVILQIPSGNGKSMQTINLLSGLNDCADSDHHARDDEQSKESYSNVGPDSWQMDVINRMLVYLDQRDDCLYSMYGVQFHAITENCIKLHNEGNAKCHHLPGAIFEQLVNKVGGSIFLNIYTAAKALPYGRLDRGCGVVSVVSSLNATPNLMQLAVAYGYCMAKSITYKGRKICPDIRDSHSIQYAAEIGTRTVLQMTNETRLRFWKECILTHGSSN